MVSPIVLDDESNALLKEKEVDGEKDSVSKDQESYRM
jgi:hypothetical protein